jgi:hypothetical protein
VPNYCLGRYSFAILATLYGAIDLPLTGRWQILCGVELYVIEYKLDIWL